jgi:hypothetical protein
MRFAEADQYGNVQQQPYQPSEKPVKAQRTALDDWPGLADRRH